MHTDETEERGVLDLRGAPVGIREEWPPRHVQQRGTEEKANENFAEDRRLPEAVGCRAAELGGGDDERQEQQNLQQMRHSEYQS